MVLDPRKLVTAKLIFEARHIPVFDRRDVLKAFAAGGISDYEKCEEEGGALRLIDSKGRVVLVLQTARFGLDFEGSQEQAFVKNRVKAVLDAVVPSLPKKSFVRIGVRYQSYYTVDFKFDELCEVLAEKLFSADNGLQKTLAKRLDDLLYVAEYTKSGVRYRLQVAPIKREQLWQACRVTHDRERKYLDSPENSVYVDLDCYVEDYASEQLLGFVQSAHSSGRETVESVISYVLG